MLAHVHYTPGVGNLDNPDPCNFQLRANSFRIKLCSHTNLEKFSVWLILKKVGMGRDSGYSFLADSNLIKVYIGKKVNSRPTDESHCIEVRRKCTYVNPNLFGEKPLYFVAHFVNSAYFDIANDEYETFERKSYF